MLDVEQMTPASHYLKKEGQRIAELLPQPWGAIYSACVTLDKQDRPGALGQLVSQNPESLPKLGSADVEFFALLGEFEPNLCKKIIDILSPHIV